ncbi:MAG: hypothetical protein JSV27_11695, partial [Candidatus Bathyarchaeota archaeon]
AERNAEVEGMSQAGKVSIFSPGAEVESEAESEQEPEPEQDQPEEPDRGIPGFQYIIILGLIAGVVILWLLQRRR